MFYDPARVESARQLCEAAAKHNASADFILTVQELLGSLAKICEGKATPDMKKTPGDTNLQPFRSDLFDSKSVCEELRTKICASLNPTEARDHGLGYIYILRSQSYDTLAELKIGFSKHHPEHRAHQLAGCLRNPEVVPHSPMIPHANRIETIIHAELVLLRKTQFCVQCQQQHKEWFTMSHIHARQVITRWSRWVLSQPYRNGVLTRQWQDFNRLAAADRVSKIWTEIIDTYPIDESIEPADKQIALYVNAIFLEKDLRLMCDLFQLPTLKGDFGDLIRIVRTMRNRYGTRGSSITSIGDLDIGFMHLFDSVIDFGQPQSSTLKDQQPKHKSPVKEVEELVEHPTAIKTGSLSDSSPDLGISQSPMGDATLLPVVSIEELEYFDGNAKLGIGYNPTNSGFQFVQEAYQRGEWEGSLPRFKRPKGLRLFRTTKSPSTYRQINLSSRSRKVSRKSQDAEAPSSYRMKEPELSSANSEEPVFTATSPRMGSNSRKRKMQKEAPDYPDIEMGPRESTAGFMQGSEVIYKDGEDGEESTVTFRTCMPDNFIDEVEKATEEMRNGGRQKIERRLNKALRYFGIETMVPSDDNWATENGESSSEDDLTFSEASSLQDPSNQHKSDTEEVFSKNSVAAWF